MVSNAIWKKHARVSFSKTIEIARVAHCNSVQMVHTYTTVPYVPYELFINFGKNIYTVNCDLVKHTCNNFSMFKKK